MVTVGATVALWLQVAAGALSPGELRGLRKIAEEEVSQPIGAWVLPLDTLDYEWYWAERAATGVSRGRLVVAQLIFERAIHLAELLGLDEAER